MTTNIYLDLTREFNAGRTRCIVSSGQAVVLHHLAIMSKDGDWIVREDNEALEHVLTVLQGHGAHYRLGAPMDARWMSGGWSAHFEFRHEVGASAPLRMRTDFVSRPPRLDRIELEQLWAEQETQDIPVVDLRRLVELKKTNRERDYAVIGELARHATDPEEQILMSRSALDLLDLAMAHPRLAERLAMKRPALEQIALGREALEASLDAERRALMRLNEDRLATYIGAAQDWNAAWPGLDRAIARLPLRQAHELMVREAERLLPQHPLGTAMDS